MDRQVRRQISDVVMRANRLRTAVIRADVEFAWARSTMGGNAMEGRLRVSGPPRA